MELPSEEYDGDEMEETWEKFRREFVGYLENSFEEMLWDWGYFALITGK